MTDETWDDDRARRLEALLRLFAMRILELDRRGELLSNPSQLQKDIGDIRSELFHYEVRATYDTPEIAEHRRIVRESQEKGEITWQKTEWNPDEDKGAGSR